MKCIQVPLYRENRTISATKIRNGKWKLIDRFEDIGETWLTLENIIDRKDIDEKRRFEFFGEDDYCYLISFEW